MTFSPSQQAKVNDLLSAFTDQPYTPPSVKQSLEVVDEDLLNALISTGQLIQLNDDVLFTPEILEEMSEAVIAIIKENGSISLTDLRDRFNTSRKYAVAVLEYLDAGASRSVKGTAASFVVRSNLLIMLNFNCDRGMYVIFSEEYPYISFSSNKITR